MPERRRAAACPEYPPSNAVRLLRTASTRSKFQVHLISGDAPNSSQAPVSSRSQTKARTVRAASSMNPTQTNIADPCNGSWPRILFLLSTVGNPGWEQLRLRDASAVLLLPGLRPICQLQVRAPGRRNMRGLILHCDRAACHVSTRAHMSCSLQPTR